MKKAKELDQFFTKQEVADLLVKEVINIFQEVLTSEIIETSVGSGSFVNALLKYNIKLSQIKAYDIDVSNYYFNNVVKADYLKTPMLYNENRFVIGNPPFGKSGKLALQFLNKALKENGIVAFVLPKIFERYSIQKQINVNAKLVYQIDVEKNAFTINKKDYNVNCVFQIWTTKKDICLKNQRLLTPKPKEHNDFLTFIHNNTPRTLKYFNKDIYNWNFAVHRQGFYNYSLKIIHPKDLIKNRQYLFIKIQNPIAQKVFDLIDFEKLSEKNTRVKGFSLTDLVEEYEKVKTVVLQNKPTHF
ncbi:SAM-dependent methyltransferase [Mycoplasmopsis columboralis]|uniref:Type I restriction-modification system methyltransferase subunit n=1 Tax=Mycoplasmopsis columboralis TaxID=171282 RepID=A0A449B6K2_9BACT|nr:SAM-dependent methyltransferase [Mycoplasmopsis columboralis]VEU76237.1 Type I restriction-modification system methyltransferase subunit [Mycoplasmopsis columboralis]